MGVCSYSADRFPFQLDILQVDGKKFTGSIQWPTLNNAKTKLRGTIENEVVKFEEYEAISNADDVQLPSNYEGKISVNGLMIDGQVTTAPDSDSDSDAENPSFHLDRIEQKPAAAKPKSSSSSSSDDTFDPGKSLAGSILIEQSFNMKIKKRKNTTIEGIIKWPTYKSKFKGKVENGTLNFEEYELIKQKLPEETITLPRFYKCKVDRKTGSIEGDFGPTLKHTQGTFKMKI